MLPLQTGVRHSVFAAERSFSDFQSAGVRAGFRATACILFLLLCQPQCALPEWPTNPLSGVQCIRLRGGSQIAVLNGIRKRQRNHPTFQDVINSNDAQAFFKAEEIRALETKFAVDEQGCVPFHLLSDLQLVLRKRRDKVSRALLTGKEVSDSEPEHAQPPPTVPKQKAASSAVQVPSQRRIDSASSAHTKKRKQASTEAPKPRASDAIQTGVRQAVEQEAKRNLQQQEQGGKAKAATHFSARGKEHLKPKDLLSYNPSLQAQPSKQKLATSAERYVCWLALQLEEGTAPASPLQFVGNDCQLIAVRNGVEVVSDKGFGLGLVRSRQALCVLPLLSSEASQRSKARLTAVFVENPGRDGERTRVEVLVYGDAEVERLARKMLNRTFMTVEWAGGDGGWGSAARRSPFQGREVNKDAENVALEGLLSGSGGGLVDDMEDLFEGGVEHDEMPEMDAPSSVVTELLVHQRKALHWMVSREKPSVPLFWEKFHDKRTGKEGWFNTVTRKFASRAPTCARGGMLADDMGLGKTLAMLSLIMRGVDERRERRRPAQGWTAAVDLDDMDGPTLIVAPLSVVQTWADQIGQHTDSSPRVLLYHGPERSRVQPAQLMLYDVVITTYSIMGMEYIPEMRREPGEPASMLHCLRWSRVVLDEGHLISNRNTLQSKAVIELNATNRWVVTGTPIQNKIDDLFPVFAFLRLHPLDSYQHFQRMVVEPLRNRDPSSLVRIRKLLRIFCLRRTKDQRLLGRPIVVLPGKEVILRQLRLSRREQQVYDILQARGRAILGGMLAEHGGAVRYTQVLVLLLRLRQFCNHPSLILAADSTSSDQRLSALKAWDGEEGGVGGGGGCQWESREAMRRAILDACEEIASESGEGLGMEAGVQILLGCCNFLTREQATVLVDASLAGAAQTVDVRRLEVALQEMDVPPGVIREESRGKAEAERGGGGRGAMDAQLSMSDGCFLSTKVAAVLEELDKIEASGQGQKTVIFSQFSRFLDVLERALRWKQRLFARLDGSMSRDARTWAIREFHERAEVSCLLVSLKSGGMGLNLVAANNVLLTDLWWNMAAEEQAMDRVHRVGQTRSVRVVRFVTRRTVEERVLKLQRRKQAMVRGAMQQKLSMEDVQKLFSADFIS